MGDTLMNEVLISTNTVSGYGMLDKIFQNRNSGKIKEVYDVIDDTESLGAFDTLPLEKGTRNLDIGGGKFDTVAQHVKHFYDVDSYVYDPYERTQKHNDEVLAKFSDNPADTVTSISVLNVILTEAERKKHIQMTYDYLKEEGMTFFKIYRGDNSEKASLTQSNRSALTYLKEVEKVYGAENTTLVKDNIGNTIVAKKIKNDLICN